MQAKLVTSIEVVHWPEQGQSVAVLAGKELHLLKVIVTALTLAHGNDGLPSKAPDAVGMSASRLESIDRVVQRVTNRGFPVR